MNETSKKIKELRNEINRLKDEITELEKKNSNYYIGVIKCGNGDYWDEYYYRLGFITEADAKSWVDHMFNTDEVEVYDATYFEVTKEIYQKYGDWFALDELRCAINTYNTEIRKLEGVYKFINSVDNAMSNIAKEIGIEYLSFMHPGRDI